jgi:hypothetical protein
MISGGYGGRETPVPIPNTAVKPASADGTWGEAPWESRSPPGFLREMPHTSVWGISYFWRRPAPSFRLEKRLFLQDNEPFGMLAEPATSRLNRWIQSLPAVTGAPVVPAPERRNAQILPHDPDPVMSGYLDQHLEAVRLDVRRRLGLLGRGRKGTSKRTRESGGPTEAVVTIVPLAREAQPRLVALIVQPAPDHPGHVPRRPLAGENRHTTGTLLEELLDHLIALTRIDPLLEATGARATVLLGAAGPAVPVLPVLAGTKDHVGTPNAALEAQTPTTAPRVGLDRRVRITTVEAALAPMPRPPRVPRGRVIVSSTVAHPCQMPPRSGAMSLVGVPAS